MNMREVYVSGFSEATTRTRMKRKKEKKPLHIAFAYLEGNTFSYADIGNLIAWCVAMNINNITLYDFDGKLKKQKNCLNKVVATKIPIEVQESHIFLWDTDPNSRVNEKYDNAFQVNGMGVKKKSIDKVMYYFIINADLKGNNIFSLPITIKFI